jgi:hypothetical protein
VQAKDIEHRFNKMITEIFSNLEKEMASQVEGDFSNKQARSEKSLLLASYYG